LISTSILSSWKGVHRQERQIYICRLGNELRGIAGEWGVDKKIAEWNGGSALRDRVTEGDRKTLTTGYTKLHGGKDDSNCRYYISVVQGLYELWLFDCGQGRRGARPVCILPTLNKAIRLTPTLRKQREGWGTPHGCNITLEYWEGVGWAPGFHNLVGCVK